jgi:putative transposase
VVGVFPGEASITWLICPALLEAEDERQTSRRSTQLEGMADLAAPAAEAEPALAQPEAA